MKAAKKDEIDYYPFIGVAVVVAALASILLWRKKRLPA